MPPCGVFGNEMNCTGPDCKACKKALSPETRAALAEFCKKRTPAKASPAASSDSTTLRTPLCTRPDFFQDADVGTPEKPLAPQLHYFRPPCFSAGNPVLRKMPLFACQFHFFFFGMPSMQADPENKKKKVKSKTKSGSGKASFKVNRPSLGMKKGSTPLLYQGTYDLSLLPKECLPDNRKANTGKHRYTLCSGNSCVEVLLKHRAYFAKRFSEEGTGPTGQVSWAKFGGVERAWAEAVRRSGFKPQDD